MTWGTLLWPPASARATDVSVTIHGIRNDHGQILVAICPRAEFLQPQCHWQAAAHAKAGDVQLTVTGVPPGTYAAQAFHDEDSNFKLERSFLGLPKEGMGFSHDAPMRFGPPGFDAAAFAVSGKNSAIDFSLRYYTSPR
jgi:uncharacterized protein (DUF2141 family)